MHHQGESATAVARYTLAVERRFKREGEQTALQRLELLTKQLSAEQGVTEELKEKAPMQWVGMMNNIRSQAEEVILTELIYK